MYQQAASGVTYTVPAAYELGGGEFSKVRLLGFAPSAWLTAFTRIVWMGSMARSDERVHHLVRRGDCFVDSHCRRCRTESSSSNRSATDFG